MSNSIDYTKSIATNEFYFPDENRTTDIAVQANDKTINAGYNKGFHDRQKSITGCKEVNALIPLNKFSFFEGLNDNILPPAQVKIEVGLTDDDTLLFRAAGVANGKVIVKKN